MDDEPRAPPSYFFTLRLWQEQAEDQSVWRGRLQDTLNGEVRYFQGWEALVQVLNRILDDKYSTEVDNG